MTGQVCLGAPYARALLLVAGLVVVLAFAGCGANSESGPPTGDQVQPGEDILLFAGGEQSGKSMSDRELSEAPVGRAFFFLLAANGHFYHHQVPEGSYARYYFDTLAGRVYQVDICSLTWQDDPNIYVGRDPLITPTACYWRRSARTDQYMDGIVFKATQTGHMYVVVCGYDDGSGDGNVDYTIHVRRARFATFTQ